MAEILELDGLSRFARIPQALELEVTDDHGEVNTVELELSNPADDISELAGLLQNENVVPRVWIIVAQAYAKLSKWSQAIDILEKGLQVAAPAERRQKGQLSLCLAWMYMHASRAQPRKAIGHTKAAQKATKLYCLKSAAAALDLAQQNHLDDSQISLARGVQLILQSSLDPASKSVEARTGDDPHRADIHRKALKCFDEVTKVRGANNLFVALGRARVLFALQQFPDSAQEYQKVLRAKPSMLEPNPRIGLGCCMWNLGLKKEAFRAWERVLEMDPRSKIAYMLIAQYKLDSIARLRPTDRIFRTVWHEAMEVYAQSSLRLDQDFPLANVAFGNYFLASRSARRVDPVARRALERTDVNAIASEAWYLLARRHHSRNELDAAAECYRKSDEARGGSAGNVAAKLGIVQIMLRRHDTENAKFRLERLVQIVKCYEAMTMLGCLYAESALGIRAQGLKSDKGEDGKRAIPLLEAVRLNWKDERKNLSADPDVLLLLARLYEANAPEKALACLQEVEKLEYRSEDAEEQSVDPLTGAQIVELRLQHCSPQLLNNMGTLHYALKQTSAAAAIFQATLARLDVLAGEDELDHPETAAAALKILGITVKYNLARSLEALGNPEKARHGYQSILSECPNYIDAKIRLTCMTLIEDPHATGPQAMNKLYSEEGSKNLDVRALYGWFLSRRIRKSAIVNVELDGEYRHYKHTLQNYEKHDLYSLVGMGNVYLSSAREMPRSSTYEKEKRHQQYDRAVDCFKKALSLDPSNAYAAQGLAIAFVDDVTVRNLKEASLLFSKIKDAYKNASVFNNLGHVFTEMKQWSLAVEAYESGLSLQEQADPNTLVCLGRTWFLKAREDKQLASWKQALFHSSRAVDRTPHSIPFQFNVALCQFQIAQQLLNTDRRTRSSDLLEEANRGLDDAIAAFRNIAKSKDSPYDAEAMNQRALMSSNTIKKKLEAELDQQQNFERNSAAKLEEIKKKKEEERRKRQEAEELALQREAKQKQRLAAERLRFHEEDAAMSLKRAEDQKVLLEQIDTDGLSKAKRKNRRKDLDESDADSSDGKRKRSRTSKATSSKYKSDEIVRDSSDEAADEATTAAKPVSTEVMDIDEEDVQETSAESPTIDKVDKLPVTNGHSVRRATIRRLLDDEDEDMEGSSNSPRAQDSPEPSADAGS